MTFLRYTYVCFELVSGLALNYEPICKQAGYILATNYHLRSLTTLLAVNTPDEEMLGEGTHLSPIQERLTSGKVYFGRHGDVRL